MFSTKYWDIFPLLLFLEQMVLQSPDYHFLSFAHLHQTVPPQLGVTGKFAAEYFNIQICQLFDAIKKNNEGP